MRNRLATGQVDTPSFCTVSRKTQLSTTIFDGQKASLPSSIEFEHVKYKNSVKCTYSLKSDLKKIIKKKIE